MEFRLISDIHNEFYNELTQYTLPYMSGDENRVLVIAGDFTMLKRGKTTANSFTQMAKRFKAVVYVPGNHEYYGYRIDRKAALAKFQDMNPEGLDNVHFLIRDSVVIDGIRFVGATLWTDMDRGNPITRMALVDKMNDFKAIDYKYEEFDTYHSYNAKHWLLEHSKDLSYIKKTVDGSEEPCIVVTHHAPSARSLDPDYAWDTMGNFGYHSVLDEFILDRPKIQYWLHGHIHCTSDYMIGSTKVVCNPYGYGDEDTQFWDRCYWNA
jgi:Icc-related predicted phosphoesterase